MKKTIKAYFQEVVLKPYLEESIRKEVTVLDKEACLFFRENLPYYLSRKGVDRTYMAKKLRMNPSTIKDIINGRTHRELELALAQNIADATGVNLEHLIAPLPFDIKPEVKHFLVEKKNEQYVHAVIKYVKSGGGTNRLIKYFKEVDKFDIKLRADKPSKGRLSYNDSAIFQENVGYYSRKKKKNKVYIAEKLGIFSNNLMRELRGRANRKVKLDFAKKVAKVLNVSLKTLLAPQLFYVDPYVKRFVHKDGNIQYIYALMDRVKGGDNLIELRKKIENIKKKRKKENNGGMN